MNPTKSDIIAFLFLTIIPLVCILIQVLFAFKKKLIWSILIPICWTALGIWMITAIYNLGDGFSNELAIFFSGGDILLIGITAVIRLFGRRKKKQK